MKLNDCSHTTTFSYCIAVRDADIIAAEIRTKTTVASLGAAAGLAFFGFGA
jgi:hypothetical protein